MKWINKLFESYINRLILLYFVLGFIWTVNSDYLLLIFVRDEKLITILQMVKTVFFLMATSLLLFYLLKRYERRLQKTISRLRSSNHDLKSFFYKISHDIRGPLASTIGLADIAAEETTDENARQYFSQIRKSTSKLDYLLTELMELSSILEGKADIKPLELDQLFNDVMKDIRHMENTAKLDLQLNLTFPDKFFSDRILVVAILQNVLGNAVMFYDKSKSNSFIKILIKPYRKGILISVCDNGIGINEEAKPYIFDIFYRGTSLSNGSGMGLYVVKVAVERLEGEIEVTSQEYKETCFEVYLPDMHNIKEEKEVFPDLS